MPHQTNPGIDRLLVRSALEADLRQRLLDCPDEVFLEFDLTEEQQDLLRKPDHRLLPLLGEVVARQGTSLDTAAEGAEINALPTCVSLPDLSLALTVVPCALEPKGYSYAVWVNPLPEGADPANLPPPAGATLPGRPLAPLHLVIQIAAVEVPDAAGRPQVGLTAALRQSSNIMGPPPETRGGEIRSEAVDTAVAAVRDAAKEERYGRLIELLRALRGGEVP
jgi:hypothetical protein